MANQKKHNALFTPSGCLKSKTFQLYLSLSLHAKENEAVEKHLAECALCSDALEGLKQIENHEQLSVVLNKLTDNLNKKLSTGIVAVKSKKRIISERILYFSAAASVVILVGLFILFKMNNTGKSDLTTAAMQEVSSNKVPPTPIPKVVIHAQAEDETKSETAEIIIDKITPKEDKIHGITSKKGEENKQQEKIPSIPKQEVVQEKMMKDTTHKELSKGIALQAKIDESMELESIDIASNQPFEYYLGEVIIHAEKTKKEKTSALRQEESKNNVADGMINVTAYSQSQPAELISSDETKDVGKSRSAETSQGEAGQNSDHFFNAIDKMPEFPGGNTALINFLSKKIRYPARALEQHIEGTLFITFIVEQTGKITDVKILRGIGSGCEEEAIRVVNSMPEWSPGYLNGEPVRVRFNMPITFQLN